MATPLHFAAFSGHAGIIVQLVDGGANIEAMAAGSTTPLHWAADAGKADSISMLIKHGADVEAKAEPGFGSVTDRPPKSRDICKIRGHPVGVCKLLKAKKKKKKRAGPGVEVGDDGVYTFKDEP